MSVLSAATQKQVEEQLVKSRILTQKKLLEIKKKSEETSNPFMAQLIADGVVNNESLTKTIAQVTRVPYVNLLNAIVDQKALNLLPHDIAERYMAVPLGEMQHRVVIAMIDADNVQAVDFLSNKIGRPLKVYAASEEGIRSVLSQYTSALPKGMEDALDNTFQQEETREKKDIKAVQNDSKNSIPQNIQK